MIWRLPLGIGLMVCLFGVGVQAQQETEGEKSLMLSGTGTEMFPSAPIPVSLPEGAKKTVPQVLFNHATHEEMLCGHCHHAFFVGEVIQVRRTYFEMQIHGYDRTDIALVVPHEESYTCSQKGCHTSMKDKTGKGSYYAAFHAEQGGSCYNCHVEEIEAGGNPNCPTACRECHSAS